LLLTFFDGFDIINERMNYETHKESSLFYIKSKVVAELAHLDTFFVMTNEEAVVNSISNIQI
jgi:hypothetical protein